MDSYRGSLGLYLDKISVQHNFVLITNSDQLAYIFLCFHRSLIHGIIIRLITKNVKLMKLYWLIDFHNFALLFVSFVVSKYIINDSKLLYSVSSVFARMVDSPFLLLVFLPAYFIMKHQDKFISPDK